jgi:hypothetical protein
MKTAWVSLYKTSITIIIYYVLWRSNVVLNVIGNLTTDIIII